MSSANRLESRKKLMDAGAMRFLHLVFAQHESNRIIYYANALRTLLTYGVEPQGVQEHSNPSGHQEAGSDEPIAVEGEREDAEAEKSEKGDDGAAATAAAEESPDASPLEEAHRLFHEKKAEGQSKKGEDEDGTGVPIAEDDEVRVRENETEEPVVVGAMEAITIDIRSKSRDILDAIYDAVLSRSDESGATGEEQSSVPAEEESKTMASAAGEKAGSPGDEEEESTPEMTSQEVTAGQSAAAEEKRVEPELNDARLQTGSEHASMGNEADTEIGGSAAAGGVAVPEECVNPAVELTVLREETPAQPTNATPQDCCGGYAGEEKGVDEAGKDRQEKLKGTGGTSTGATQGSEVETPAESSEMQDGMSENLKSMTAQEESVHCAGPEPAGVEPPVARARMGAPKAGSRPSHGKKKRGRGRPSYR
eukprot:GHVU01196007.1.p1 GENE.GHVU01196007.1~~GHVU01196007.1.p1  ORF type:complete len:423 (+),score=79.77 GHVU01196007.1:1169-2437(+)